jgi:hypothetical protein
MLYVSVGFKDFGNDILHDCIPVDDITGNWIHKKERIISEFGVYPNIRYEESHPERRNVRFKHQDENYLTATSWLNNNWCGDGKILDTIHVDWIKRTWAGSTGYHLVDNNTERQYQLYRNRLKQKLFNNDMTTSDKHFFAFTRDTDRKVIGDDIVNLVVQKINEIHNLNTNVYEYLDRSLFIPLYMLRTTDTLSGIPNELTALNYFVQDRVKKQRDITADAVRIVRVDDERSIESLGVDYKSFIDKYLQAVA